MLVLFSLMDSVITVVHLTVLAQFLDVMVDNGTVSERHLIFVD